MENQNRYTITLDDDPMIAKFIARATGINSLPFTNGETLLKRAHSYHPVAVFVDVHLDIDGCGIDFIPELRLSWPHVPIIVITSDTTDELIGSALASGADDFVRKPISVAELKGRLHARICEMFKRKNIETITISDIIFSTAQLSIQCKGRTAYLPKLEARLFEILLQNINLVVSRDELKRHLWNGIKVSENSLDKKISCIRKSLGEIGSCLNITALYGQGVIINAQVDSTFLKTKNKIGADKWKP